MFAETNKHPARHTNTRHPPQMRRAETHTHTSCTDGLVVKDPISDAGGPRFESHAGRVTGKPTPSLWRDKHPAIKGLRPPEHHAGKFQQDQKETPPSPNKKIRLETQIELDLLNSNCSSSD